MGKIPPKVFGICRERLIRRMDMVRSAAEELREAREWAHAAGSQAMDPVGGGRGSPRGDAIERRAISVTEAEERLRTALRWDDVFHRLERIYPVGTKEGRAAWLMFGWRGGEPIGLDRTARAMGVDRQTARRYRDTYVIACALLAAEAGLIRIFEEDSHESAE